MVFFSIREGFVCADTHGITIISCNDMLLFHYNNYYVLLITNNLAVYNNIVGSALLVSTYMHWHHLHLTGIILEDAFL